MVRTVIALLVLIAATLWLPLGIQLALYVLSVFLIPHRLLLLIPAIIGDVYYAPEPVFTIATLKMTSTVLVILIVFWLIKTKTRVRELYGVATK